QPPILEPFTDHSVQLPPETADDVIKQTGTGPQCVLQHAGFMVGRQLEMMNVLVGYEQANKYSVTDQQGRNVAFIAEEETSFLGTVVRQILGTRRSFKAAVLDVQGNVVLKVERPIKWFLNSHLAITDANDTPIGHVNQVWHPLRRKYDL
ncbi:Scramblase-domain-containing protein, partial [Chytriomyces sp. MP71]